MQRLAASTAALFALNIAVPAIHAQESPPEGCIALSAQHRAVRSGSQFLFIRDGDAHYRIEFANGSCDALNSGSIAIATKKQPRLLCEEGTIVSSRSGTCAVNRYVPIGADEYQRYARRSRSG